MEREKDMKNMKKITGIALAAAMALTLGACSSSSSPSGSSAQPQTQTEEAEQQTFKVGICQIVQHVALDAATEGFETALTEEFGDAVVFDNQNAQGDPGNCATIVNQFVSDNVDLILANATPPLQAAAAATTENKKKFFGRGKAQAEEAQAQAEAAAAKVEAQAEAKVEEAAATMEDAAAKVEEAAAEAAEVNEIPEE